MSEFTRNLDELLYLSPAKFNLTRYLMKNFKENIHYIIEKDLYKSFGNYGGHNKITYMLTEQTIELLKNSYNLRNRYIVKISDNIQYVNIGMCIENQTIGFIENSFIGIIECKRQYIIGKYRTDLYFPEYKLVIECDENNTLCIALNTLGNKIIRYNPNTYDFDLSNVLRVIHNVLFSKLLKHI